MRPELSDSTFGRHLEELLVALGIKQAELARRLDASPQWVNQIINGGRRPTNATIRRIATALGVPKESIASGAVSWEASPIGRLEKTLQALCKTGSSPPVSCTLYLRDSLWQREYRLAACWGVSLREPLSGFLSAKNVTEGERFVFDTHKEATVMVNDLSQISPDVLDLYGTFCQREGVRAYARVVYPNPPQPPDAILFLNYAKPRSGFSAKEKEHCRGILASLQPQLAAVRRQLVEDDRDWLADA